MFIFSHKPTRLRASCTSRRCGRAPGSSPVVLLLSGVVLLVRGISGFVDQAQSMEVSADFGPVLTIAAGGFCVVLGLAAANVGWMRAQASYVAGETVPVVEQSLDHLTAGPFCRQLRHPQRHRPRGSATAAGSRLPDASDLRIARVAITHRDAQALVEAVQEEYVAPLRQPRRLADRPARLRGPARAVLRRLPRR